MKNIFIYYFKYLLSYLDPMIQPKISNNPPPLNSKKKKIESFVINHIVYSNGTNINISKLIQISVKTFETKSSISTARVVVLESLEFLARSRLFGLKVVPITSRLRQSRNRHAYISSRSPFFWRV